MKIEYKDLLDAGVHFGHLTRKWDPKMSPYIFMEKNGIHLIDINKTLVCLDEACKQVKELARNGKKILFVATKKQAQEVIATEASRLNMPFVTERWLGGMLTNFTTIKESLKKLKNIEKQIKSESFNALAKREKLMVERSKIKLEDLLGGLVTLNNKLPDALFIVDIKREHLAVSEAQKLGIKVFAMVDTNSNPNLVEFPIPANDDAYKSISLITKTICAAIEEGNSERKKDKDKENLKEEETAKRAIDEAPIAE
jgi:small subunit ribosomal protein S2